MRSFFKFFAMLALYLLPLTAAVAASTNEQMARFVKENDEKSFQAFAAANAGQVDDMVRSLLALTSENLTKDSASATRAISFAAQLAPRITPPSVPAVCSDLRQIVASLPADSAGKPLLAAVVAATRSFAKAPVVAAAGRPSLCEEAWIEADNLGGEEAELAQTPGYKPPNVQPNRRKPSGE